jgi:hypothetical protein
MSLKPILLVAVIALACSRGGAVPPAHPLAAGGDDALQYFVGRWLASAEDPGTGRKFTLDYELAWILKGAWLRGGGGSPELALEIHDLWGRDPVTREIVRVIFDSEGTFATVRSRGWQGDTLVFEGEARSKGTSVPVRETIKKIGPAELHAVWEAKGSQGWTPYSVERLRRQSR